MTADVREARPVRATSGTEPTATLSSDDRNTDSSRKYAAVGQNKEDIDSSVGPVHGSTSVGRPTPLHARSTSPAAPQTAAAAAAAAALTTYDGGSERGSRQIQEAYRDTLVQLGRWEVPLEEALHAESFIRPVPAEATPTKYHTICFRRTTCKKPLRTS